MKNVSVTTIFSRYDTARHFTINKHTKKVRVKLDDVMCMRAGARDDNEEGLQFIDPDGGPMICINNKLSDIDSSLPPLTITHIVWDKKNKDYILKCE